MKTIAGEMIAVVIAFCIFTTYFGMSWGSMLLFLTLAFPAVVILVIRDKKRKDRSKEKNE